MKKEPDSLLLSIRAQSPKTVEMSIYTDIKLTFSNDWEEIPEFDETDRMVILALISNKSYYTYYDYQMVTNTGALFSENEVLQILEQMFPSKMLNYVIPKH